MTGPRWTRNEHSRPLRELPASLTHALARACDVEDSADNRGQLIRAAAGTSNILYAAVCAGWTALDLGRAIGMERSTVGARVRAARARHHGAPPVGIEVERPYRAPQPLDVLRLPLGEREWLTLQEACEHTGTSVYTIRSWRRAGILPNSYLATSKCRLYLRADLHRVMKAPRYRNHGAQHQAVRDAIAANGR